MKTSGKVIGGVAIAAVAIGWQYTNYLRTGHGNFGLFEVTSMHRQWIDDAHECFQHDPAKTPKSELEHCDHVFAALGNGDPHQGIQSAIAELTGVDCAKERSNPNLTDEALKLCAAVWWPAIDVSEPAPKR